MKNLRSLQRGITMMEVMVSVAVIATVLAVGIPNLSSWVQNTQVKSTAETVLTGLQLARGEAVRQNSRAKFLLTKNTDNSADWTVITASSSVPNSFLLADGATEIQKAAAAEMGVNARLNIASGVQAAGDCSTAITSGMGASENVVFDAFGKVVSTTMTRIDVIKAGDTGADNEQNSRRRVILISQSGAAKLCRPGLPSSNPQGCP